MPTQRLDPNAPAKPLSIEELARIRAELEAGSPRQDVLQRVGLSEEAFVQAEALALEKISAAASRGSLTEARRFVALVEEQRLLAQKEPQRALVTPAAAKSVALVLPELPLPPLEKAIRPPAAPIEPLPRAHEPTPPPRPKKQETMAMPAFSEDNPPDSDGLPFQKPAKRHETMAMPAFNEDHPPDSDGLPFQKPSRTGPPAPAAAQAPTPASAASQARAQSMSLAMYARLCADVRRYPQHVAQIRAHYQLDEASWTALHSLWRQRFEEDPTLRAKWQLLIAQHLQAP